MVVIDSEELPPSKLPTDGTSSVLLGEQQSVLPQGYSVLLAEGVVADDVRVLVVSRPGSLSTASSLLVGEDSLLGVPGLPRAGLDSLSDLGMVAVALSRVARSAET